MKILIGVVIVLLTFFTFLIRGMQKRGHPAANELMARTQTFWVMTGLFIIALAGAKILMFLLLAAFSALALHEYFSLSPERSPAVSGLGYLLLAGNTALAYFSKADLFLALTPLVVIVVLPSIFVLKNETERGWSSLAFASPGILFFSYGLAQSTLLVDIGPETVIYCFFLTEIRDLVSYWLGKALGKWTRGSTGIFARILNVRVAERVSPNKTWAVGVISALLIGVIAYFMAPLIHLDSLGSAALGIVIAAAGLMGDLVFSLLKREAGVKDSGTLLPGKSGVIDRVDSLALTIPVTFHFLYWLYVHPL